MKLLTKNSDYAVRALLVLAIHKGEYVSARKVAAEQKLPYQFLRRILQVLIKEGLVESKEGGKGGVRLVKDPASIHLVEVIKLFQGEVQISECMFRHKICQNRSTCVLRRRIGLIEKKVAKELAGITIGTLLRDLGKHSRGENAS
jgi:Rrf2 family protein